MAANGRGCAQAELVASVEGNFPELTPEVGRRLHLDDVEVVLRRRWRVHRREQSYKFGEGGGEAALAPFEVGFVGYGLAEHPGDQS
jgi:hypothetical protein